jgi:hypothetical protein
VAAEGLTAREIARHLGVRERTVTTHLGRIYGKLGVNSRVGAVIEAARSVSSLLLLGSGEDQDLPAGREVLTTARTSRRTSATVATRRRARRASGGHQSSRANGPPLTTTRARNLLPAVVINRESYGPHTGWALCSWTRRSAWHMVAGEFDAQGGGVYSPATSPPLLLGARGKGVSGREKVESRVFSVGSKARVRRCGK